MILKHMKTLGKLLLVKEIMIAMDLSKQQALDAAPR